MQAISGSAYTVTFEFMQDGEYVVPDDASVTYKLYGNDGAQLSTASVDTDNNTNTVQIAIASGFNTVASGLDFEQRTVRVSYKLDGKDFTLEQWYYVTGLLNYRVTPRDVVIMMGIKEGEVLFDEIDLIQAYFKVSNAIGSTNFTSALSSGGIKQIKANEAIKITAALDLMRVIELKAFRKMGNELNYARFDKIDFAAIRESMEDALNDAIATASDLTTTSPGLFLVTSPVNPITG